MDTPVKRDPSCCEVQQEFLRTAAELPPSRKRLVEKSHEPDTAFNMPRS